MNSAGRLSLLAEIVSCILIMLASASALTSCTSAIPDGLKMPDVHSGGVSSERVSAVDVEAIAKSVDQGFEDGWIAGKESRVFKSPYRTQTARSKADFAIAYHDFLEPFHQDIGNNVATYVPYKKRAEFARNYWMNSPAAPVFKAEKEKYQIAWLHESLLDGSELWWRAAEKKFGDKIDSVLTLVHDNEQMMVSKYMEDEATEGTFSGQMSDKSKPASGSEHK